MRCSLKIDYIAEPIAIDKRPNAVLTWRSMMAYENPGKPRAKYRVLKLNFHVSSFKLQPYGRMISGCRADVSLTTSKYSQVSLYRSLGIPLSDCLPVKGWERCWFLWTIHTVTQRYTVRTLATMGDRYNESWLYCTSRRITILCSPKNPIL